MVLNRIKLYPLVDRNAGIKVLLQNFKTKNPSLADLIKNIPSFNIVYAYSSNNLDNKIHSQFYVQEGKK